jgi:hypothetical protein
MFNALVWSFDFDLRDMSNEGFWKTDTIPTKFGVSLSLPQWKVLYSAMQVVDDLISRVKDGKPFSSPFIVHCPQIWPSVLK